MSYFGLHMFVSIHQPCLHCLQMQLHGVNKRKAPTNNKLMQLAEVPQKQLATVPVA